MSEKLTIDSDRIGWAIIVQLILFASAIILGRAAFSLDVPAILCAVFVCLLLGYIRAQAEGSDPSGYKAILVVGSWIIFGITVVISVVPVCSMIQLLPNTVLTNTTVLWFVASVTTLVIGIILQLSTYAIFNSHWEL